MALLTSLNGMAPWPKLFAGLQSAIDCDLQELCVCNSTPLTLFAWAMHPDTQVPMRELALSLGRLQMQPGSEELVLPLWVPGTAHKTVLSFEPGTLFEHWND